MTTRKYPKRRETWGALRKLPSGRYQASYPGPDGKRYTARTADGLRSITFDTKDDARAWLSSTRTDINRGTWRSPEDVIAAAEAAAKRAPAERFSAYATAYVEERAGMKGEPLRPKTRAGYLGYISHGLAEFADDPVTDITSARVRKWHAARVKGAATAAGNEARFLRSVLNLAVVDGLITANPVPANLTRSRSGATHRPPTSAELATMLDEIPSRFRLAVILAAFGGLRLSEWRALRRQDILLTEGRVLVDVSRSAQYIRGEGWHVGPPKSAEGERVVPLPSWATQDVEHHLSECVGAFPGSLLFAASGSSKFLHDSEWNRAWNTARDAAGVRRPVLGDDGKPTGRHVAVVREHDLRGHAGTSLAQTGATLRDVMGFLGHSTSDAAMVYQHTAADRLATLADQIARPVRSGAMLPIEGASKG